MIPPVMIFYTVIGATILIVAVVVARRRGVFTRAGLARIRAKLLSRTGRDGSVDETVPVPQGAVLDEREPNEYQSAEEFERKFNYDPEYLRMRIEAFLRQPESEEALRRFCESTEFTATYTLDKQDEDTGFATKVSQDVHLRLVPMTDQQLARVPASVQAEVLSGRTRKLLPSATVTPPTTHAAQPPLSAPILGSPRNGARRGRHVPGREALDEAGEGA